MSPHMHEWLSLAIRWLHVVAGITWIGESFYFMWLDASLRRDETTPDEVKGESWSVHGGGFYRVIKFQVAPAAMPKSLHWFKWEAYTTWLSGFLLLFIVYWSQAQAWMVEPGGISPRTSLVVGGSTLVIGWVVYDLLCKSRLGRTPVKLGLALLGFATLVAWLLTEYLAPRAAYIHVGAMIGTWMAGNVLMVIIPNQKKMVATMMQGGVPDPALGLESKLRSTHNNYLTLPVIFVMISNHYPSTYGHQWSWLILLALFAIGALTRVFFNMKNAGRVLGWVLPAAAVAFLSLAMVTAPRRAPVDPAAPAVTWAQVEPIIQTHCVGCHSATPTSEVFTVAPLGVTYDTPEQVAAKASTIKLRAVDSQTMPLGNPTGMTEHERAKLGAWIDAGAPIP